METLVANPWFIFFAAVIGVVGGFASIRAMIKKKPEQSISVGGNASGKIQQQALGQTAPTQEIEIGGEARGDIRQTRE